MNAIVVDREEEQATLVSLVENPSAEFLALYGRRRVGKTFLITNFFSKINCAFFYVTGIKNGICKKQINEFTKVISNVFYGGVELKPKNDWMETFELLTNSFASVPEHKKIILFMDEFPWLATRRSGLLEALDYYWNRHWVSDKRIKLIICGSSASWIISKILDNKGGLHNRVTRQMCLDSFNLRETKEYLQKAGVKLSNKQILAIYLVTGGVPFYLANIPKGLSAAQIIEMLAFKKNSLLLNEFDNLFSSLFDDFEGYEKAIRLIAARRDGIGQEELLCELGQSKQGMGGVKMLKDLERAGFIMSFKPHLHKKRGIYYRVIDAYMIFYFGWIEPVKNTLLSKNLIAGYWGRQCTSPKWHSWAGYAFEALCYKHLPQIINALNLNSASIPNSWRYVPKKGAKENGTQIDLLFDRDDDAISLCEIKYTDKPFEIDKQYAKNLMNKIEVFKSVTRTTKQIFIAMISVSGIKPTMYSEELISACVTLDDLFKRA